MTIQGVSTPTPSVRRLDCVDEGTDGTDVMMGDLVLLQEK